MVLCRTHTGSWAPIAQLSSLGSLPAASLAPLQPPHLLLAATGNQLRDVLAHSQPSTRAGAIAESMAEIALLSGGPLPPYHPAAIAALLARGQRGVAASALRSLLSSLRQQVCLCNRT